MPGGKGPACSMPSLASGSAVAPETLQRPEPAIYVMPAGSASVSWTLVPIAVPELVYDSVTVIGPAGEGPLLELSALVTTITEFATVVVSVFASVVGAVLVSVAETPMSAVLPLAAPPGTAAPTTERKVPAAASAPEVLIGVALSGTPSPFASM